MSSCLERRRALLARQRAIHRALAEKEAHETPKAISIPRQVKDANSQTKRPALRKDTGSFKWGNA